jgi:hypothetical protein
MKYFFMKSKNAAYDFCVRNYLKEGGIDMDDIPWERARFRLQLLDERRELLTHIQEVFLVYARAWIRRRNMRPAFYDVFWHIFGHLPSLAEVREQESKLPKEDGKLLFSAEEIAQDVFDFYKKFIGGPLRKDISDGATVDKISRYLTANEWTAARRAGVDPKGIGREQQKAAVALLAWFEKATPTSLLRDVEGILGEHYGAPPHLKLDEFLFSHEGKKVERCNHASQYLKLDVAHDLGDGHTSVLLAPIRGEAQVRDGWLDVDFPWYHVLAES